MCAAAEAKVAYVEEGIGFTVFQVCRRAEELGFHFTDSDITCGVPHATSVIVDCVVASALLYFVVTYILLLSKLKGYRKQPYTFVQVGLVYNTLQVCFLAVYSSICPNVDRIFDEDGPCDCDILTLFGR